MWFSTYEINGKWMFLIGEINIFTLAHCQAAVTTAQHLVCKVHVNCCKVGH